MLPSHYKLRVASLSGRIQRLRFFLISRVDSGRSELLGSLPSLLTIYRTTALLGSSVLPGVAPSRVNYRTVNNFTMSSSILQRMLSTCYHGIIDIFHDLHRDPVVDDVMSRQISGILTYEMKQSSQEHFERALLESRLADDGAERVMSQLMDMRVAGWSVSHVF